MWGETAAILIGLLLVAAVVVGAILGIIAFALALGLRKELPRMRRSLGAVESRLGAMEAGRAVPREAPRPAAAPPPVAGGAWEMPVTAAPPPAALSPPPLPMTLEPVAVGPGGPPAAAPPPAAPGGAVPAPTPAPSGGLAGIESRIGKRWIAWAGVIVLFFGAAFFLKHAFENAWIGPTGQVIIGAVAGLAILITGSRFISKGWRVFGQCLMGLGLAILYATFFAAFSLYPTPVMSRPTAFGLMVAVTAAGVALAVLHNALSMAFMAVLGGLLTPVLLSTGRDARDALFTYLLLLDLGVLAVALFRGWRLLDALALAGTFALYGGWYVKFYESTGVIPALAWLGAFYAVFLALPFLHHLVRRVRFTVERFVMALANAAFAFGLAWHMLHEDYSFALGFVALGMAAAYLVLGSIVRRRLPDDAPTLFGAIAMTVTFLTLAIPLQLRAHGIMLAWALEGPVLLYLGYRFRYRPVRAFAAAVLVVSAGRLFLSETHWPLHAGLFAPLVNSRFLTAMMVPVAMALYALIHERFRRDAPLLDRAMKIASALAAAFVALVIVHAELGGWVENEFGDVAAGAAVTALWALGAAAYLLAGAKARAAAAWTWGAGALAMVVALVLGASLFEHLLGQEHILYANARFASCLLAAVVVFAYAWTLYRTPAGDEGVRQVLAAVALGAGLVVLLALLSAETHSFCVDTIPDGTRAGRAAQMSITLVWGLYAAGLVFVGFWRRWRPLRLAGLGLFGLSALKLVVVDLTHVQDIYRIVSFLVLGMLMVVASYLYHRLEKRLTGAQAAPAPPEAPPADGERA